MNVLDDLKKKGWPQSKSKFPYWGDSIHDFNSIQSLFLEYDIIALMPTGIDEYRIFKSDSYYPFLTPRWPLPDTDNLFQSTDGDVDLLQILGPEIDDGSNLKLATVDIMDENYVERVSNYIEILNKKIFQQISARDFTYVLYCESIFVYRPLIEEGQFSSGVDAEIRLMEVLHNKSSKQFIFVHFWEDLSNFFRYSLNDGKYESFEEITERLISKYIQDHDLDSDETKMESEFKKVLIPPKDSLDVEIRPERRTNLIKFLEDNIEDVCFKWILEKLSKNVTERDNDDNSFSTCIFIFEDFDEFKVNLKEMQKILLEHPKAFEISPKEEIIKDKISSDFHALIQQFKEYLQEKFNFTF